MLHNPKQNHLLAALPSADLARLLPDLELVAMPLGAELYESSHRQEHVYFPINAVMSVQCLMEDGVMAEADVVGNEGIIGISQLLIGEIKPNRISVQNAGYGYRLNARLLQYEFNHGGPILRLLLRYAETQTMQMAHTAACHRQHSAEQKMCRCLLGSLDRAPSDSLTVTLQLVSSRLGLSNQRAVDAAEQLHRAGLISYHGDQIDVLDRVALKSAVCACYETLKAGVGRLLQELMQRHFPHPADRI